MALKAQQQGSGRIQVHSETEQGYDAVLREEKRRRGKEQREAAEDKKKAAAGSSTSEFSETSRVDCVREWLRGRVFYGFRQHWLDTYLPVLKEGQRGPTLTFSPASHFPQDLAA